MVFKKTMLAILALYLITFLHGSSYAITSQESYSDGSEKSFWSFGVPRVLDWSDYGLAVGTSTGHLLVYDHHGSLRWERRLNYTSTWDVSWSDSGELAVVSLGPPGVLYVFNHDGALLWSMESEHQANSVAWSGDMLAVGADSLMVFDKSGKLLWSKGGDTLAVSWCGYHLAAIMCLGGPEGTWGVYVFDKEGSVLWGLHGFLDKISWSSKGDLAILETSDGVVYVFDHYGSLKWSKYVKEVEPSSLMWLGDLLAVGGRGGVVVLDERGEVAWKYELEYCVQAISSYGDFLLGVGLDSGNFTLLDSRGNMLWSYWTCGYVWAIKFYSDKIAIASSDGYVHVLDGSGTLLWKRKLGFHVEAVALHRGLVAVGGWDSNVFVLDLEGNVKWSSETGWVAHLAWYEDLLAVGGYSDLYVFDEEGSLKWSFSLGKVRSLSWSSSGLLAVGLSNGLCVFTKDGTLLWGYRVPDWVISLSWSGPLLAVGVAGEGVFVFDEHGGLKWFFKSTERNATIPWRVSASWWRDALIVVTDKTYALDKQGDVLWSREIYGTVIAPGKDFVAFGGAMGIYVLDEDGELEWSYTPPESVKPKEYYTKPYPQYVYCLSWMGNCLVAGDWLGLVLLFNETGDLMWSYCMGSAAFSVSVENGTITIGGDGGLLIKKIPLISEPKKMLLKLPVPYDKFNLAYINKTLLYMNGSTTIIPPQYLCSPGFTVSNETAYAFLEATLSSSAPIQLTLMTESELKEFTRTRSIGSKLTWTGKEINVSVQLDPGTYFLVLRSTEQAEVSYFIKAYESSLPSFEEARVYLPIGIVDYGVTSLPEGRIGYSYEYVETWGLAEIRELYATRPFDDDEMKHCLTLQLNAFLHVKAKSGWQVYWVQNIVILDTETKRLRLLNNLWNATTYPISMLNRQLVKGNGSIAKEMRAGDYYFYIVERWMDYSYPLTILLHLSVKMEDGTVRLEFGKSIANEPVELYDAVLLHVNPNTACFKVDPTTYPLSDLELVLAGPSGVKPKTVVERIDANLKLLVNINGELIPIPTAYSHGYITHERVKGVYASYCGDYVVRLSSGKATPTQVYYSTKTLPSMQLLWIRDPLDIFSGVKLIEMGRGLEVPIGYLIDLGNRTRLILKSYEYTSKNEVTLNWGRQYYISATSDYGVVEGIGWYDEGDEARITISPIKFEEDSKTYKFKGWEENGTLVSASPTYVFKVQFPTTLKAKWTVEGLAISTELLINIIIGVLIAITITLVIMLTRRGGALSH
ncbi:MAG: thermopsin family protease [Candidatus Nezhaarchaeales archaeon]|nr:MAG: hypothetical protein DSO06_05945 [Candidatus Nezhaarchaeota archaeon WYZ-LMO8]